MTPEQQERMHAELARRPGAICSQHEQSRPTMEPRAPRLIARANQPSSDDNSFHHPLHHPLSPSQRHSDLTPQIHPEMPEPSSQIMRSPPLPLSPAPEAPSPGAPALSQPLFQAPPERFDERLGAGSTTKFAQYAPGADHSARQHNCMRRRRCAWDGLLEEFRMGSALAACNFNNEWDWSGEYECGSMNWACGAIG